MTQPEPEPPTLRDVTDLLRGIDETLASVRFYLIGMFVGITTIGILYAAVMVWALANGRFH